MAIKVQEKSGKIRRATSVEAREDQLISLAYNRVEQRIIDGTATSQELVHFLKLGSSKERLEKEKIQEDIKLAQAKEEALRATGRMEELMADALKAFKSYNGTATEEYDD